MRIFILLAVVGVALFAKEMQMSIATGERGSTYYIVGEDIQDILEKKGTQLEVIETVGSRHNFDMINGTGIRKADFAIAQEDLLLHAKIEYKKKTKKNLQDEFKVILPLFSEEVHLFKKAGVKLVFPNHKKKLRIACGSKLSGSCLTTKILSIATKQKFSYFHTTKMDAFRLLKKGDVDLVLFVEGKPSRDFRNLDGVDMIDIPDSKLIRSFYKPTTLTSKNYSWLTHDVKTISVDSVIMTAFDKKNPQNDKIREFLSPILENKKKLKSSGHPKWKDVSFQQDFKHGHPEAIRLVKAK